MIRTPESHDNDFSAEDDAEGMAIFTNAANAEFERLKANLRFKAMWARFGRFERLCYRLGAFIGRIRFK